MERRLDTVLEEKDFAEKSFKEQLNQILEEEVGFRQERAIKMRLKLVTVRLSALPSGRGRTLSMGLPVLGQQVR